MAIRVYLLPTEVVVHPRYGQERRPRHIPVDVDRALIDSVHPNACLCAADVTVAQHDAIALNADVLAFPENLDDPAPVNTIKLLNVHGLPSHWFLVTMTARDVVASIAGMFCVLGRYRGREDENLIEGVNLDERRDALTDKKRTGLDTTVQTFKGSVVRGQPIDKTDIFDSTTIGDALYKYGARYMAQRDKPLMLLDVAIVAAGVRVASRGD